MAPSWFIGMPWTQEMLLQVPSGPVAQGWRLGELAGAGGRAVSESCFCIQYRLCLPEELPPVSTSSVWVSGLEAGRGPVCEVHHCGGLRQEDAEGLRNLGRVGGSWEGRVRGLWKHVERDSEWKVRPVGVMSLLLRLLG